jgi:hypothetical protein
MYGFVEQLLHYFGRPHAALPAAPLAGRGAWKGEELARSDEWRERLTDAHVAELQRAVETASRSGKPTRELTVAESRSQRHAARSTAGGPSCATGADSC